MTGLTRSRALTLLKPRAPLALALRDKRRRWAPPRSNLALSETKASPLNGSRFPLHAPPYLAVPAGPDQPSSRFPAAPADAAT
jgi:hypothetical protein